MSDDLTFCMQKLARTIRDGKAKTLVNISRGRVSEFIAGPPPMVRIDGVNHRYIDTGPDYVPEVGDEFIILRDSNATVAINAKPVCLELLGLMSLFSDEYPPSGIRKSTGNPFIFSPPAGAVQSAFFGVGVTADDSTMYYAHREGSNQGSIDIHDIPGNTWLGEYVSGPLNAPGLLAATCKRATGAVFGLSAEFNSPNSEVALYIGAALSGVILSSGFDCGPAGLVYSFPDQRMYAGVYHYGSASLYKITDGGAATSVYSAGGGGAYAEVQPVVADPRGGCFFTGWTNDYSSSLGLCHIDGAGTVTTDLGGLGLTNFQAVGIKADGTLYGFAGSRYRPGPSNTYVFDLAAVTPVRVDPDMSVTTGPDAGTCLDLIGSPRWVQTIPADDYSQCTIINAAHTGVGFGPEYAFTYK